METEGNKEKSKAICCVCGKSTNKKGPRTCPSCKLLCHVGCMTPSVPSGRIGDNSPSCLACAEKSNGKEGKATTPLLQRHVRTPTSTSSRTLGRALNSEARVTRTRNATGAKNQLVIPSTANNATHNSAGLTSKRATTVRTSKSPRAPANAGTNIDALRESNCNNNNTSDQPQNSGALNDSSADASKATTPTSTRPPTTINECVNILNNSISASSSISSSMVEYIGTQFKLINSTIADFKNASASKLDEVQNSLTAIPKMVVAVEELLSRVSSLENKISSQNAQLDGLKNDRIQLLHENRVLKENINNLITKVPTMLGERLDGLCNNFVNRRIPAGNTCNRGGEPILRKNCFIDASIQEDVDADDSDDVLVETSNLDINTKLSSVNHKRKFSHSSSEAEETMCRAKPQLVLSSIYDGDRDNMKKVVYACLATVLPSLKHDDIVDISPLSGSLNKIANGNIKNCGPRTLPWLVQLCNENVLDSVLVAKRSFTSLHTRSINVSALDKELADSLVQRKIFINQYLPRDSYKRFRQLKTIAQSLNFKYIWHKQGKFLVKWQDGARTHEFSNAEDLLAISTVYNSGNGNKNNTSQSVDDVVNVVKENGQEAASAINKRD